MRSGFLVFAHQVSVQHRLILSAIIHRHTAALVAKRREGFVRDASSPPCMKAVSASFAFPV